MSAREDENFRNILTEGYCESDIMVQYSIQHITSIILNIIDQIPKEKKLIFYVH